MTWAILAGSIGFLFGVMLAVLRRPQGYVEMPTEEQVKLWITAHPGWCQIGFTEAIGLVTRAGFIVVSPQLWAEVFGALKGKQEMTVREFLERKDEH